MIIDEERIHNYTHTNQELSALNIKYYKFGSSFDTTEFYSGKLHVDTEAIHSTLQGQHLVLRCRPQKRSMPMRSPSTRSNRPKPGPPIDNCSRHHQKGEELTTHS
jgi:hypothetical protein